MSKNIDEEEYESVSSSENDDDIEDVDIDDDDDDAFDDDDDDEIDDTRIGNQVVIPPSNKGRDFDEDDGEEYDELNVPLVMIETVEDDEPIENYLHKINDNMKTNIIANYHPQLKPHNFEEIRVLLNIKRNKNGDINDDYHRTSPFMTKYERTRILAERTVQINMGMQTFLDNSYDNMMDGFLIAMEEMKQKKIPFIIKRPLPNGAFEYWNACDLEML